MGMLFFPSGGCSARGRGATCVLGGIPGVGNRLFAPRREREATGDRR